MTKIALLLSAGLAVSCRAPMVPEAGHALVPLAEYPGGSEEVLLYTEDQVRLRGVFTPASDAVPRRGLVTHFLPAGASVTSGLGGGFGGVKESPALYAAAGWDSLMVDYRGVGASGGDRGSGHLAVDARAVWAEANGRRDAGDLLVIRGVSLGSLAVASLLADGVDADGVILQAPVRAPSIVGHGARDRFGPLLGPLFAAFFRDPPLPDLLDHLAAAEHLLLVLPEEDRYLSAGERELLLRLASEQGAEALVVEGHDHDDLVLRAFGFELSGFSGRQRADLPPEEALFLEGLGKPSFETPSVVDDEIDVGASIEEVLCAP